MAQIDFSDFIQFSLFYFISKSIEVLWCYCIVLYLIELVVNNHFKYWNNKWLHRKGVSRLNYLIRNKFNETKSLSSIFFSLFFLINVCQHEHRTRLNSEIKSRERNTKIILFIQMSLFMKHVRSLHLCDRWIVFFPLLNLIKITFRPQNTWILYTYVKHTYVVNHLKFQWHV